MGSRPFGSGDTFLFRCSPSIGIAVRTCTTAVALTRVIARENCYPKGAVNSVLARIFAHLPKGFNDEFASQHWSGAAGAPTFQRSNLSRIFVGAATAEGGGVGTFALSVGDDFRDCAAMACPLFAPACSILTLPPDCHFVIDFRREALGFTLRNAQRLCNSAVVSFVAPGSSGEAHHLEAEDVLVKVEGRSVRQTSFADIQRCIGASKRPLSLTFMRLRVPEREKVRDGVMPSVDAFQCVDAELWGFHAPHLEYDDCSEL